MKLFQYEMKKLLFNKNRLILLGILFALYTLFAFLSVKGEFELSNTEQAKKAYSDYIKLARDNAGTLNPKQLAESKTVFEAAVAEHGRGEELSLRLNRDPALKFHSRYVAFGQKVDEYWNGPKEQVKDNIMGIHPIQEKLAELESANQTDTYEYRLYKNRLKTELSLGEPVFENAVLWNYFFIAFEGIMVTFLLLMVLTFIISPLFTQEVKTEMDSIVLCSVKGRREIVTAKLLCACLTTAIVTTVYLVGWFTGTYLGNSDLSGFDAPARCLEGFQQAKLDMTIGGAAVFGTVWLILATVAFGLALSFVSSKMKNQSAAFGVGIVILLSGSMSNYLGSEIKQIIWPFADFNFGTLSLFSAIFGGSKTYNLFGLPVSYGAVAFVVCLMLGAAACLLTYIAQKKRTVM